MKLTAVSIWMYIFALLCFLFTVGWVIRDSPFRFIYSGIGLASTVLMVFTAYFINQNKKWAWWLATLFSGGTFFTLLFDEVGVIDLAAIVFVAAVFIVLVKSKPTLIG